MGDPYEDAPPPSEIKLHQKSRLLEVIFPDGKNFQLSFEMLRVFSPSAEVRGHGIGQETLQVGKINVDIAGLDPVGMYAIKPTFSDGHDSGLYTWGYLYWLGDNKDQLWADYLTALEQAGESREPAAASSTQSTTPKASGCGNKN